MNLNPVNLDPNDPETVRAAKARQNIRTISDMLRTVLNHTDDLELARKVLWMLMEKMNPATRTELTQYAFLFLASMDEQWEQAWQQNLFESALARVRKQASPKAYQVFDYCVLQEMSPGQVAQMLGMNAAQVYLAKHRVSAAVKRAVREIEVEMGVHPPQCCYGGRA